MVLVCAAPLLIHGVPTGTAPSWIAGIVVAAQLTAVFWLLGSNLAIQYRAMLCGLVVAAVAAAWLWLGLPARSIGLAISGSCHAAVYACLLIWFATSLRSGREPVITGFARSMRRTMPDRVVHYTRKVTVAWCLFFAAQLGVSAALLIAAPVSEWSDFVALWNFPLVVAMGLAEFGCRMLLFRRESHTGLVATLAGLRQIGGLPRGGR